MKTIIIFILAVATAYFVVYYATRMAIRHEVAMVVTDFHNSIKADVFESVGKGFEFDRQNFKYIIEE